MFWSTLLKDPTQNQQKKQQRTPEMESIQTREAEIKNIKKCLITARTKRWKQKIILARNL